MENASIRSSRPGFVIISPIISHFPPFAHLANGNISNYIPFVLRWKTMRTPPQSRELGAVSGRVSIISPNKQRGKNV